MNSVNISIGKKIKKLREDTGYSQEQLASLLHIKRPTLSQIENGERKISADDLIQLAKVFNIPTDVLLNLKKPPNVIFQKQNAKANIMTNNDQIRISVPQKNLKKFKQVLLYILNKVGSKANIGETVLYKLLYFTDFDFYEKYEEQLIGATYIKNLHGPTPLEFKKIIARMIKDKEVEKVKSDYFNFPQTKYLPLIKPDLSNLSAREIEIINNVLNKLSDYNATQISEYSHNDVPWLVTEDGEVIDYETVFYRTALYSVRDTSDEL